MEGRQREATGTGRPAGPKEELKEQQRLLTYPPVQLSPKDLTYPWSVLFIKIINSELRDMLQKILCIYFYASCLIALENIYNLLIH